MPYESDAQRKFFHTKEGMKKVGAATVKEFDQASKGKKLPEYSRDSHHPGNPGFPSHPEHSPPMCTKGSPQPGPKPSFGQADCFRGTHKSGLYRLSGKSNAHRIGKK
ncbi:MAG TPA: hypothetical protein VFR24_27495 [Candidatus Angelobacter sp.]|nr:hypothetical protein [Candidatus Angelobacter sp.]